MAAVLVAGASCYRPAPEATPAVTATFEVILSGLDNPRGIALGPDGELYLAEAGTGYDSVDPTKLTGRLSVAADLNGDGDLVDPGEVDRWFNHFPTYNALYAFGIKQDEVSGPGDVLLHRDGRVFLSVDGGFDKVGLYEISPEKRVGRNLADRANMNGLAFDAAQERIYAVEGTANTLIEITLADGELREIVRFPTLETGQQAVPAGVAVDPETGEVLVALFSGAGFDDEADTVVPVIPGTSKVVRVDPSSGEFQDEITGLTSAVDVATDGAGNVYVVEMTSDWADLLDRSFDVRDPDSPPVHGGYLRHTGRVTLYPADGGPPLVLADGLDMPTNVTVGPDGALYVSTGQGTPGRPIPGPDGPAVITGEILRISDYLSNADD